MKTIYLTKIIFLSLFFVSISLFALTPEETKTARKRWLNGYEYFEKGEKTLENEQLRESHTLFTESLNIFNDIKIKYPGWSSSMIEYRVKLCNTKIAQIKKLLASKNIKITDNDVDKENLLLKNRLNAIEQELKQSKRKLSITLTSLEAARREAARNHNSSAEMGKLLKEKTELEKRYALLLDRNKNLQLETGTAPAETAEESKKALDAALLKMEAFKKENEVVFDKLKKEQGRFAKIAGENTLLKYDNKVLVDNDKKTKEIFKKLKGEISEHNEIIARWEQEKVEFGTTLNETHKTLEKKEATIKNLTSKLDEIRNNPNEDTIAKQLGNENKLLLKDLEVVHLQLAKELKEKKNVIEAKNILNERVARIEKALAIALQNKNKSKNNLNALEKKAIISDTIIKKQDKTISDQKVENNKILKELEELADKYRNIDKKEKEFIALANQSIKAENENRMMKTDLEKEKLSNKKLSEEIKKSEMRMVQIQKEIQKIISDNAKSEKQNFIDLENMKAEISALEKNNAILKSELKTNHKKLTMMTEELISVNSLLTEKEKVIEKMADDAEKAYAYQLNIKNHKEPEIISTTPAYKTLEKENNLLATKLNEKEAELAALKLNNSKIETVSPLNEVDLKRIKKMLDSAFSAEENEKKEAASWYYENVLNLDPENKTALNRLGYIKAGTGNYEEAIELLKKGLLTDSDDIEKLQVLTFCFIRNNQYYDALSTVAKANSLNPKDPVTLRYLGQIFGRLGWVKGGEKFLRNSFKIDPTSSETAFNSAVLLTSSKDRLKEAKLWYDKAIELGAERDPGIEKTLKTAE